MRRSDIFNQLSSLVGRNVGAQFARGGSPLKRALDGYAEGDTVAEELVETSTVTYTPLRGDPYSFTYNPATHGKPDPSGRMQNKQASPVDDVTRRKLGSITNYFDYASRDPVEEIQSIQKATAPVSVAPEDHWTDSDIYGDQSPTVTEPSYGTGRDAMKEAEKRAENARRLGNMVPYIGGWLGGKFADMSWKETKEGIDRGIGKELLGLTEKGELAESGGVDPDTGEAVKQEATVAAFQKDMEGKAAADEYKDTSKMEGSRKDAYDRARASQALQNAWAFGKSLGRDIAKQGTLTDEDIRGLLGLGGKDPSVGGGQMNQPTISQLGSWSDPNDGIGITAGVEGQEQAAADAAAAAAWKKSVDEASSIDVEGLNWDVGTAMEDYSDESGGLWMAKGGIAQLANGGEAASDKHLEPGSFVLSADVVSGVGDGSTEAGIERMSGLLGIPLDGSIDGPNGSMLGRVTTADGGSVPGTGLSDSVNTVIKDTVDETSFSRGLGVNDPLSQVSPQGKTAAKVARDEIVIPQTVLAQLPVQYGGADRPSLQQGQQMMTNFMDNVRKAKFDTGGKQPGPLVGEGQDPLKGLAAYFQRA